MYFITIIITIIIIIIVIIIVMIISITIFGDGPRAWRCQVLRRMVFLVFFLFFSDSVRRLHTWNGYILVKLFGDCMGTLLLITPTVLCCVQVLRL